VRRHADGLGVVDSENCQGQPRTHTADTEQNVENFRSSSLAKPNRVRESSRTIREVKSFPSSPVRSWLSVCGVA
jgi:hypothetical protein